MTARRRVGRLRRPPKSSKSLRVVKKGVGRLRRPSKIIKKSAQILRVLQGARYRQLGFRLVTSHHSVGGPRAPVRNDRSQKGRSPSAPSKIIKKLKGRQKGGRSPSAPSKNHQKISSNSKGPPRGSLPATRLSPRH